MPELQLVTVANVHLASVGTWECSTGTWECTPEDLAAIVGAQDDPGIRTAILKLGHVDNRFDGEPAVGRVGNLRLSDDGMELYGDYIGIPKWLGEIIESAFPSRSVEVYKAYAGSTGHTHAAVLTGVALLGVTPPAIASLDDVRALYAGEYEELVAASHGDRAELVTATAPVVASISMDNVRSEFYERLPAGSWAWIREIWSDFLIVDDDDGELFQIPWSDAGDGKVEFGAPVAVEVQYVPSTEEADEGEPELIMLGRFASKDPRLSASSHTNEGESTVDKKDLLALVGLDEDATEEQYAARLSELGELAAPEAAPVVESPAPLAVPELPDGVSVIDTAQLEELVSAAAAGRSARDELDGKARDDVLTAAVKAGKFPPARKAHWAALWDKDPEGTKASIAGLAAGLLPVAASEGEHGHAMTDEAIDEAFWGQVQKMSAVIPQEGA